MIQFTKKFRFFFRLATAFVFRYVSELFIGLVVGIVTFLLAPYIGRIMHFPRPVQTVGVVGRYTTSDLPEFILRKMSLGLTEIDATGLPGPALAESWEATDSGQTYIFTLRQGIRWQDNTLINSEDIKYNFKDVQVSYPDFRRLMLRLPNPFSPLPTVVSRPVFKKGLVGTGSYKISQIKRNGNLVEILTLAPIDSRSGQPNLRYYFFSSERQARTAFKLGQINSIADLADLGELVNWPNTAISRDTHFDRYVAIFFNTSDPDLAGVAGRNLRQALSYAVDKSRWSQPRVYSPINPNSWAYNDDIKRYDYDPVKARDLLKKVEKIPQILLTTVPAYLPVAEAIKSDWEAVGVTSQVTVTLDVPEHFTALVLAQAIPTDPDQYSLWHSTQESTNLTKLKKSPRLDKLLEDGRKLSGLKERREIYSEFQKYLLDEAPAAFLFHPQTFTVSHN